MHRVQRHILPITVVAVVLAACTSGSGEPTTTSVEAETTISVPATTTSASSATTTSQPGRPLAPDFTLELADGGVYSLSEGENPVYLVFWAEW